MNTTIRMSGSWNYKGRSTSSRTQKTFDSADQARAYVRKVIANAREDAKYRRTRNSGKRVRFISVWPEGTKVGDTVDVWSIDRGWHKGEVFEMRSGSVFGTEHVELRARSKEDGRPEARRR